MSRPNCTTRPWSSTGLAACWADAGTARKNNSDVISESRSRLVVIIMHRMWEGAWPQVGPTRLCRDGQPVRDNGLSAFHADCDTPIRSRRSFQTASIIAANVVSGKPIGKLGVPPPNGASIVLRTSSDWACQRNLDAALRLPHLQTVPRR